MSDSAFLLSIGYRARIAHLRDCIRRVCAIQGTENMTLRSFGVLLEVASDEGLSVKDLAISLRAPPPAMTRAVEALIEREMLSKEPNPGDRRKIACQMQTKGLAVVANALAR